MFALISLESSVQNAPRVTLFFGQGEPPLPCLVRQLGVVGAHLIYDVSVGKKTTSIE